MNSNENSELMVILIVCYWLFHSQAKPSYSHWGLDCSRRDFTQAILFSGIDLLIFNFIIIIIYLRTVILGV